MADKRDYYDVLGVGRSAGQDEIKSAYRKLARTLHPDVNPGDATAEDKFKEVAEAYEVLSDQQKRGQYDRFGHSMPGTGGGGAGQQGFGGFEDLFSTFFGDQFAGGGGRRAGGPQRGQDIEVAIDVTLEEAFNGGSKDINIPRVEACSTCSGSGAKAGSKPETCTACGGAGQVRQQQSLGFMTVQNVVPCVRCGGRGQTIKDPCTGCGGKGRVQKQSKITVPIMPGIDEGMTVPLRGEGHTGAMGGPSGDLYAVFRVKEHDRFVRDGHDLYISVSISFVQAALGAQLSVTGIDGREIPVTIPEGTQPEARFTLRGHGMPDVRRPQQKGNLIVVAHVVTPTRLSDTERQKLEEFAELRGDQSHHHASEQRTMWDRFKRVLRGED